MKDEEFVTRAIELSERSAAEGRFPAGAVIAQDGMVLAEGMSDAYPGYQHAETRAVDDAFCERGKLSGATLYTSMEPCLMCLSRAYWAGIRRIVYAIGKDKLKRQYYEGTHDNRRVAADFTEALEYLHIAALASDALVVVHAWERKTDTDRV